MIDSNRIKQLIQEVSLLVASRNNYATELEKTKLQVIGAKNWMAVQPNILFFLQQLQSIMQEKNVIKFGKLLTAFTHDVLDKDKSIELELYTSHNLPALKIEANNKGFKENILLGSGGALANIISTGLRIIALSRTNTRKFLILDEPDCWIKPGRVKNFAKVLGEISQNLNIQILIISHHKSDYFKEFGRVIELKKEGQELVSEIISDVEHDYDKKDKINSIKLVNLMSHRETNIELHPYITCIIGDNDIGKSVVSTAFRAVGYNDSSDSFIRHGENESKIVIDFDDDKQILWQRFIKLNQENTQKVKYTYYHNGDIQNQEFNSSEAPQFIKDSLGIFMYEDIDIQIGNQKEPVFLIDSKTKPQDRAKILSLGKESIFIQNMMEFLKEKTKDNKNIIKNGEIYYNELDLQIKALNNIDELHEKINSMQEEYSIIDYQKLSVKNLEEFSLKFKKISILANLGRIKIKPLIVELKDTSDTENFLKKLKKLTSIAEISKINRKIEIPNIKDIEQLAEFYKKYKIKNAISSIHKINYSFNTNIDVRLEKDLIEIIDRIKNNKAKKIELKIKLDKLALWEEAIKNETKDLLEQNGNICPECGQAASVEHFIKFGESHD